jgi:hypothetical protein
MKFLIIGDKSDVLNNDERENIHKVREGIQNKKHVFLFTFMNTCGPCLNTKPKWDQMIHQLNQKYKDQDDLVVARVNYKFLDQLGNTGPEPSGYPSLRYIGNQGAEEYEDSGIPSTDRSTESFIQWVTSKIDKESRKPKGHSSKTRKHSSSSRKSRRISGGTRRRKILGGKWSMKYKKSINCRNPKGFSQRQHCKYGRKNWK